MHFTNALTNTSIEKNTAYALHFEWILKRQTKTIYLPLSQNLSMNSLNDDEWRIPSDVYLQFMVFQSLNGQSSGKDVKLIRYLHKFTKFACVYLAIFFLHFAIIWTYRYRVKDIKISIIHGMLRGVRVNFLFSFCHLSQFSDAICWKG